MASETAQMKTAQESAEKRGRAVALPIIEEGMAIITCAASELVPTVQFGNCTVGPIQVMRYVVDDENLAAEIQKTQTMCEAAVAEERQTIQALMRSRVKTD